MATQKRLDKIEKMQKQRQEGIIVFENIFDMHNAHAGFRSCEAFGFKTVYLVFESTQEFNPKKTGKLSSASANKWLDFKIFKTAKDCIKELKDNGYKIVSTCLDDSSESLLKADLTDKKIAIVFGNEKNGISQEFKDATDTKLLIPMYGMVQSFNLSVSVGIILWEINRQREQKGRDNYLINS
jgi:tRNA (guanosine-2'-O-)-methyltransferase